ncbi:hypothetical protein BGX38DRAFT_1197584 [Terfezia claveryi]|nr:hypothetical protein BGX38DRAFT_1197584 [Terfezia claveryi]
MLSCTSQIAYPSVFIRCLGSLVDRHVFLSYTYTYLHIGYSTIKKPSHLPTSPPPNTIFHPHHAHNASCRSLLQIMAKEIKKGNFKSTLLMHGDI